MSDLNQYNATAPTLATGELRRADEVDSKNNKKVTIATLQAGEDIANNVMRVEKQGNAIAISTATTTTVKSGAGHLYVLRVTGGTMGTIKIYDNTAASGTVLMETITAVQGLTLLENVTFSTGLTIVTSAATVITGSYR